MIEPQQAFLSDFIAQGFGLPIAHENEDYKPTPGTPWVRVRMFPAQTVSGAGNGGALEQAGFFQFTLNYPVGKGAVDAKLQAQTIFTAYPISRRVSYGGVSVRVTAYQQFDAAPESGWFRVVGRIFYEME